MNKTVTIPDPTEHYRRNVGPIEHTETDECEVDIENIGWTLGNDCPYKCKHCYSTSARIKGMDLTTEIVDRVVDQIKRLGAKTINLGGNEPLFTNGISPQKTLLPYIIEQLSAYNVDVGLTTSGISLTYLEKHFKYAFHLLNDIDISLDSPYEHEHNENRGGKIYNMALEALEVCKKHNKQVTIVMCAMSWNFTEDRIEALVELARHYGANLRINPIKPVEAKHMEVALTPDIYYKGFSKLMSLCKSLDLTEPTLAGISHYGKSKRCPCGRKSFRIHSITPDGKIPISPCVYLHDYKIGNLVEDDLLELVESPQFKTFRRRNRNPELIEGCQSCDIIASCGGGVLHVPICIICIRQESTRFLPETHYVLRQRRFRNHGSNRIPISRKMSIWYIRIICALGSDSHYKPVFYSGEGKRTDASLHPAEQRGRRNMETGTLLNYGTGSIRLLIPEEALSRQLTEYCSLMYPLHEETGAAAHWTFKIVGSELLEKCIRNTDRSALLQLEHDMAGFKGQNRQESWFLEAKRQWAVYINHKERQVHAWVSQDDPFNFARKLIRQIVSSEHQKAGAALIHASAVEYNGGAYVFAGDKGAGKTTVMMNLIAAGSAMYLGNDAVLLTPEARAVPVLAGPFVGLGTLGGIDKYRCLIPSKFAAALEARESSDYEASVQKK